MTPKRIQAVVEKIHKCFSYIHNPNFNSFRRIENLSSHNVEVKVRPDFTEKIQNLWLLLQKLQRWHIDECFSFFLSSSAEKRVVSVMRFRKKVCFCWKMMRCANKFYNFLACKEHKIETFLLKGFLWATANAKRQISLKSNVLFQIVWLGWLVYRVFEFSRKTNF